MQEVAAGTQGAAEAARSTRILGRWSCGQVSGFRPGEAGVRGLADPSARAEARRSTWTRLSPPSLSSRAWAPRSRSASASGPRPEKPRLGARRPARAAFQAGDGPRPPGRRSSAARARGGLRGAGSAGCASAARTRAPSQARATHSRASDLAGGRRHAAGSGQRVAGQLAHLGASPHVAQWVELCLCLRVPVFMSFC